LAVGKPSVLIPNVRQCQFAVTHRNKAPVADVSHVRTWQVWLYLAAVMNLFSRKIVRWAAGPPIHREFMLIAVLVEVRRRRRLSTSIPANA
jgi:putative transposase